MNIINYLSTLLSIDAKYILLIIKTLIIFISLDIIKRIIINILKKINNNKKEYEYTQKLKITINTFKIIFFIFIWSTNLSKILTLITVISGAITIALRDFIFNFFAGIYIKIAKPFNIEDRIEVNNHKGDVVNLNTLNFELLEVDNADFTGQSTGVITHVPNSIIFTHPVRNYNKAFDFIWNEIIINVPLDADIEKTKKEILRIVNKNDVIKMNPEIFKQQVNNASTDYRIYFNQYEPTIYMKIIGDYVEYTVRYSVDPKHARYVNSSIWKHILKAYQDGELELYNKDHKTDITKLRKPKTKRTKKEVK